MQDELPEPADDNPFTEVPIEITVAVGHARPTVRELLELTHDAVLPLDRGVDDPVELYVGEKLIARGELQESEAGDGSLVVCITEVTARPGPE